MAATGAVATTAAASEASAMAVALEAALANQGSDAALELIALWNELPVNSTAAQTGKWLDDAARIIMSRRSLSRALGIAYYRAVRALRIGTTTPHPDGASKTASLNSLRDAFELLAAENESRRPKLSTRPDRDVPIDDLPGIGAQAADREKEIAQQVRDQLMAAGPGWRDKQLKRLNPEDTSAKVDAQREAIRQKAGDMQSNVADRLVKDGAREYISDAGTDDPKAMGWVRVPDSDPCAWCAMLASRGLTLYSSKQSAGGEGDLYHARCNCHVEPVFSAEDYKTSALFKANRALQEEWKKAKGSNVKWPDYWNAQRRAARSSGQTTTTAQEASK